MLIYLQGFVTYCETVRLTMRLQDRESHAETVRPGRFAKM